MRRNRTTHHLAAAKIGPRGLAGRGGGQVAHLDVPTEYRGTSVQVCGLFPFSAGAGTPMTGVPVGRVLESGATLCMDPISWFNEAGLIHNPSMIVLGKPALGKSTLMRRLVIGLAAFGVRSIVMGDLKPDYADLITALGGQVVRLGRGQGSFNVLDSGETASAAARLSGPAREQLLAQAHGRRLNLLEALITISRDRPVTDTERTVLSTALHVLDQRHRGVPVLGDLVQLIDEGPPEVRAVTLDRGDERRYRDAVDPLHASLLALLDGAMGQAFARPTTTPISLSSPGGVCIDISGIDDGDVKLTAAILLACWAEGMAAVEAAHALADAGLEPRRNFFLVLDELWRVLRAAANLVDRVDALTRLNRQVGIGQALITHTLNDLLALPTEAERIKAKGFAERAGLVLCAGLPEAEMPALNQVVRLSQREMRMLVDWSTPASWDPALVREADPPGRGMFLAKIGGRPGIAFHLQLVPGELAVNDTNKRWDMHVGGRFG